MQSEHSKSQIKPKTHWKFLGHLHHHLPQHVQIPNGPSLGAPLEGNNSTKYAGVFFSVTAEMYTLLTYLQSAKSILLLKALSRRYGLSFRYANL